MPQVSVIIPVYNAEKYLKECLDSVINQTLKDIEIICVDDGSTDSSLEILNEYVSKDNRVRVLSQVNSGSASARNRAINEATGEYIGFVDSDDYISLNYFSELYQCASVNNADVAATDKIVICENGRCYNKNSGINERAEIISTLEEKAKIIKATGVSCNKIYKSDFLRNFCIECLEIKNPAEDNYFTDLAIICANKIAVTHNSQYYYVMHNESQTQHLKSEADFLIFDVYEKIEEKVNKLNLDRKIKEKWLEVINERRLRDTNVFYNTMHPSVKEKFKNFALQRLKSSVIFSLTSYPKRINIVHLVVSSLLKQSLYADKIILWLSEEEFPNKEKDLPIELLKLADENVTFCIRWCENIKPYKKLIPTLKCFPNSVIITFDDDVIYNAECAKNLYDEHLKYPKDVIGNRGHYITFSLKRKIRPYRKWLFESKHKRASYNCLLTGVGGILYPPNCFFKDIYEKSLFEDLSYNTDDLWFWAMGVLKGTKFRICSKAIKNLNYIKDSQVNALYLQNCGSEGNNNDKNIQKLLNKYPQLYKKLNKYYPIEKNLHKLFSVKNVDVHKVVTILGLKLKFKSKKLVEKQRYSSLENKLNSVNKFLKEQKNTLAQHEEMCDKIISQNTQHEEMFSILAKQNDKCLNLGNIIYNQIKIKKENNILSFRTVQNVTDLIRQKISILPEDVDLVVGIPRSGIIPAYLIALFLNKNVCSLNEFVNDMLPQKGERPIMDNQSMRKKVLVVDDSIYNGNALNKAKTEIENRLDTNLYDISYCAIFALEKSKHKVDYYFDIVDAPRMFQWNYLNHNNARFSCFDMDGVLCVDPTEAQNDDGDRYREFILNAKPLYIPSYKINSIVTSRLEKYRAETEEWLQKHNVQYEHLYMLDLPTAEERRRLCCHADFKAKVYLEREDCNYFIESNREQALKIANLTGKQVICVETDEYFVG
ncbi:MAG: glycosyltransferase [Fusobacterium sp.]|nr:glycosyltransferase [Fusobacterium sp.]